MIPLLILSFLLYCPALQTSIISVDYVKNTMPELKAEKFVLFGDDHIHRTGIDKQQLAAITQVLLKRDRESDQEMHILVEQQAGTPFYYSVKNHIQDTLKDCVHTTVENIEMRCSTGAACYMLDPAIDPQTIFSDTFYDSAHSSCCVGSMVMSEVDLEINRFKGEIDTWVQTLPPQYAQAIHIHEPEYDGYLEDYRRGCAVCNIMPETNVLQASRLLYKTAPKSREYLYQALDDLSAMLFDMHILKSVLSLKTPAIIALVAGTYHTTGLLDGLQRMGNQVIARYGKTWGPDIKPLPIKHLDINPGYCSSCWWCSIQ